MSAKNIQEHVANQAILHLHRQMRQVKNAESDSMDYVKWFEYIVNGEYIVSIVDEYYKEILKDNN